MKELQERMAQENTPALAEEYRRTEDAFLARDGYQIEVKIKTVLTGMGFAEHGFDKCGQALRWGTDPLKSCRNAIFGRVLNMSCSETLPIRRAS